MNLYSRNPKHEPVDVAVVGGGLVGSALVAAIASNPLSRGLRIVLIDPKPPSLDRLPPASLRTSTITPSSRDFLQDISAWPLVPVGRIAPFHDMVVWDCPKQQHTSSLHGSTSQSIGSVAGALHFDAGMNNSSELGFVVDNDTLRFAIYSRIHELQNSGQADLTIIPSAIRDIDFGDNVPQGHDEMAGEENSEGRVHTEEEDLSSTNWPVIHMDNGASLSARLVVACDGARSRVRTLSGLDWFQKSYEQFAVVATVTLNEPISTAYQRFLSTGPLAVLPMASADDRAEPLANIVWTTTPTEARALNAAGDNVFINELNVALADNEEENTYEDVPEQALRNADDRAGRLWNMTRSVLGIRNSHREDLALPQFLSVHGKRGHFPLLCGHAPRYIDDQKRTVLVGDAAHNIHPLAGQGVNLGFGDARSLSETIASAAGNGRDIGGENGAPLMRYQAERMSSNIAMMGVLHSLHHVFSVNSPEAFRDLRRVGMSLLNASGPAKRTILRLMR